MTTLYKTGAISIGAGSTNVTGSGTAWTTSGTRPGDLLIAGGAVAEIASVSSAAGITLANGWPGATQAAVNYAILQLDDGLRALIAANTLLQALDGGTLTSLADLPGVANKLPYFTGENVMGLTNFGAAARAFLAAGPVITSNALDATAGRLMKVRDFGLGASGWGDKPTLTDFKAPWPVGIYRAYAEDNGAATPNGPTGTGGGDLYVIASPTSSGMSYFVSRGYGSGAIGGPWIGHWQSSSNTMVWTEIYTKTLAVGSVSQSGGVPTGALIERGSNGNGDYVRFADGTQICWHTLDDTGTAWAASQGPLYTRASAVTWVYPASFSGAPLVLCTSHIGNEWVTGCRPRSLPGTGSVSLLPWTTGPSSAGTVKTIFSMALGRWC